MFPIPREGHADRYDVLLGLIRRFSSPVNFMMNWDQRVQNCFAHKIENFTSNSPSRFDGNRNGLKGVEANGSDSKFGLGSKIEKKKKYGHVSQQFFLQQWKKKDAVRKLSSGKLILLPMVDDKRDASSSSTSYQPREHDSHRETTIQKQSVNCFLR